MAPDTLPEISAGPFLLRSFERRDVPMVVEASADPLIPLISTVPAGGDPEAALAYVERQRRRLADGFGFSFVIADAASGGGVGSIGLWTRDLDLGRASVGYWVVPGTRRRGAASQALRALSTWAIDEVGVARLELYVEPWNIASSRTAESAGYSCEGLLRSWQAVGAVRRDMSVYSFLPSDGR
ncbi:MAG: GNAT family N-acetyltransferase [Acidimicrobiales bacterium]